MESQNHSPLLDGIPVQHLGFAPAQQLDLDEEFPLLVSAASAGQLPTAAFLAPSLSFSVGATATSSVAEGYIYKDFPVQASPTLASSFLSGFSTMPNNGTFSPGGMLEPIISPPGGIRDVVSSYQYNQNYFQLSSNLEQTFSFDGGVSFFPSSDTAGTLPWVLYPNPNSVFIPSASSSFATMASGGEERQQNHRTQADEHQPPMYQALVQGSTEWRPTDGAVLSSAASSAARPTGQLQQESAGWASPPFEDEDFSI